MAPESPIWDPHSVSTVDLWTFIAASSHRGELGMVIIYASKKARRFETWSKDVNRIRNGTLWWIGFSVADTLVNRRLGVYVWNHGATLRLRARSDQEWALRG